MATTTIRSKGKKPITFKRCGLHNSLNVPCGSKIPAEKIQAALNGDFGPKARAQAAFYKNVLKKKKK